MQKVLIEWVDSRGVTSEWEFIDELDPLPPVVCRTIGFLLDDHEDYKTIAQTVSDTQVVGRITIPACSIRMMVVLTESG